MKKVLKLNVAWSYNSVTIPRTVSCTLCGSLVWYVHNISINFKNTVLSGKKVGGERSQNALNAKLSSGDWMIFTYHLHQNSYKDQVWPHPRDTVIQKVLYGISIPHLPRAPQ